MDNAITKDKLIADIMNINDQKIISALHQNLEILTSKNYEKLIDDIFQGLNDFKSGNVIDLEVANKEMSDWLERL